MVSLQNQPIPEIGNVAAVTDSSIVDSVLENWIEYHISELRKNRCRLILY